MARPGARHTGLVTYAVIWLALLVFTAATVLMARVDMGAGNILVALGIASTKAALVVAFYMHLKDHAAINRGYFALAVFFILLLVGLTVADVRTRFPLANPPIPQLPPAGTR